MHAFGANHAITLCITRSRRLTMCATSRSHRSEPGSPRSRPCTSALPVLEMTDDAAPFCALSAADFSTRLGWIARLNSTYLRSAERHDQLLILTYDQRAASDVRELVAREKVCCPSVSFSVAETPDSVMLGIAVSGNSRVQADDFLSRFAIQPVSNLTCPACGFTEKLQMPTNACMFFHECASCRQLLRPVAGDCCVFCSYGDVVCPPKQAGERCTKGANCCIEPEPPTHT